jgi:hypothetical protein
LRHEVLLAKLIPSKEVTFMTPRIVAVFIGLGLGAAINPTPARADSITEPVSISATVGVLGTVFTSQFAAFNPVLGTLVSMSASLSGTLNYAGGGIPADEGASLELQEDPVVSKVCSSGIVDCIFIPALGTGLPFSFTLSGITDPTVLSNYSGTGLRDFGVYDFAGNFTDMIAMTGAGTVTFDYTASPVPESTSIGLVALGLFGIISTRHRPTRPR